MKIIIVIFYSIANFCYLSGQTLPKIGKDHTLEICNWNIEWFGKIGFGPKDKELQFNNIKNVINESDIDLFAFQEVANALVFDSLMKHLPNYNYCISNYSSELKIAFAYKKQIFKLVECKIIGNDSQAFFSTGRFPLEITLVPQFDIGIDTLFLINIHLKAHTGTTQEKQNAYQSRKRSCDWIRNYLLENYKNKYFMVLGDWNDDIDESIYNAWPSPMSGLILNPDFHFLTQVFNQRKLGTTAKYPDAIDHQLVSSALNIKWVYNQTDLIDLRNYLINYSTTTSDHFPVYSIFNTYTLKAKPIDINQSKINLINPNPANNIIELNKEFEYSNLKVFDTFGRDLKGAFKIIENEVYVNNLPVGIYWMMGIANGEIFKVKFVIER
ncbi:MAG: T9SS type A sorting domain-containing protein [Bacteroidota bacterium]|nr:T9SS type A sorting domain-containing protein [Bacteroidota bacterium]